MSNFNYVVRDDEIPRVISCDNFHDLNVVDILKNDYEYILDSMKNESYYIYSPVGNFFEEILYNAKVVGFVIFDALSNFELRLIDCYILPEYRKNGLFLEVLSKFFAIGVNLRIVEPTRYVVELLIKYGFAKKVNENIVVSAIEFDFDECDINSNSDEYIQSNQNISSNFYDLSICSTIFCDGDNIVYHDLLKKDLDKYGSRKELNDEYFDNIKKLFSENFKYYNQVLTTLREDLPDSYFDYDEIVGEGDELSDYLLFLVRDGFLDYDGVIHVRNKLRLDYENGEIKDNIDMMKKLGKYMYDEKFNSMNYADFKSFFNEVYEGSDEFNIIASFFDVIGDNVELGDALLNILMNDDVTIFSDREYNYDLLEYDEILSQTDFNVDFSDEVDRKRYFDYLLKNRNEKYKLNNEEDNHAYPLQYNLDMFNVLKWFKKYDNYSDAIIKCDLPSLEYENSIKELLLKKGYVDETVNYDNWNEFADKFLTVKLLKEFLRENNLKVSGNKQELIDRVRENNLSLNQFTTTDCSFTKAADNYLKDNCWMEFYNIFLLIFDFADFYNYFEKHSGDIDDIAFEYLDEQIELANTNDDFDLLNNCVNIKKLIDKYYEELFINSHIFV